MSKGIKKTATFIFLIVSGITAGTIVGKATNGKEYLSWLSYGTSVGISTDHPMIIDLSVFKLAFGFTLSINIAQIIFIFVTMIIFYRISKKL